MPQLIGQTAGSIGDVKNTIGGLWGFLKTVFPYIIVICVILLIIYLYVKYIAGKMSSAFGRRKLEIDRGSKASKDPSLKDVYYYKGNKNIHLGKYKGHIISSYTNIIDGKKNTTHKLLFVLISKGLLSDILSGPMLVCAPENAVQELWIKKKKNMLLVGKSFEYDLKKDMYFLTGKWGGLKVIVTKMLCDDSIMELTQDYVGKLFTVQDQMVQQLDIDLKKKMKGVEDVVEEQ